MDPKLTDREKTRRLPWLVAHSALNTIFCKFTVFGSVFTLFLDELGLDKSRIGFLLSLIPFCGISALFIAPLVARVGFKRTYIIFWGMRKCAVAFLLLTPYVLARFGQEAAFLEVSGVVLLFALCRAIGEMGGMPWSQEIIPNDIRGKFAAIVNIVTALAAIAATAVAGYVIGYFSGLERYMVLVGAGVVTGLLAVGCVFFVPGGAAIQNGNGRAAHIAEMLVSLRDKSYRIFLAGIAVVTLTISPMFAFIPLFMKEQIGLTSGRIVFLDAGILLGGLLSSYAWGCAADRHGSKLVMLSGLWLMTLLPLAWFVIPRHTGWSGPVAAGIAFLAGVFSTGWQIGADRYFYNTAVPPPKKTAYMAVFYAWSGVLAGIGPLVGGQLLDMFAGIRGTVFTFVLDRYTPLFAMSLVLLPTAALLLRGVQEGEQGAGWYRKITG